MEPQILEGTLAEVQQQLRNLLCASDERLHVVVTPAQASATNLSGSQPFRPAEFRNGVPLLPRRPISVAVTLELVKQLLDEEDVERLHADRTAGHQHPAGYDRPDAPPC